MVNQQNDSKLKVEKMLIFNKTNRACNENTVGNLEKPIEAKTAKIAKPISFKMAIFKKYPFSKTN